MATEVLGIDILSDTEVPSVLIEKVSFHLTSCGCSIKKKLSSLAYIKLGRKTGGRDG